MSPLRRLLVLAWVGCLGWGSGAVLPLSAEPPPPPADSTLPWASLAPHPRLFAGPADWVALRDRLRTDPVSARLFALIRADADTLLAAPPVALVKKGRRLLEPVREAQRRIVELALTARLTGDSRYAQRAIAEMRHLAAAPDWNPSHFLDTAEAALALGTGYDWLHDQLTAGERAWIEDALIEKALRPSFAKEGERPHWWVAGTNNWNQVCHGGLTAGALAIAEREPELARRTVQRAVDNLRFSAAAYAPDGAYPEGPMYWGYGTTFHLLLIEALRHSLGTGAGLDGFPGFMASADYLQQVTTPAGRFYAYADGVERRSFSPALFWFARRLDRPDLVRSDLALLEAAARKGGLSRLGNDRFTPFALLWYDPSAQASPRPAPLHWFARGGNPLGVHRSAWNDPRAVYLALKGGSPATNHAHMDAGSFLIEADGVTWAADTGMQNYYSLESLGVKLWASGQDGQRWQIFRIGPESHNLLRFNQELQQVKGAARLIRFKDTGDAPFTQFDLTSLYAGQVASAHRGARLRSDRRIVLQDEWTALADRPVTVTWQWLTVADVGVSGSLLTLRQKGESLQLQVRDPADVRIEVEDVSKPRAGYDVANPGLKRIRLHTRTDAGSSGRIVVLVTPGSAAPDLVAPDTVPLSDW